MNLLCLLAGFAFASTPATPAAAEEEGEVQVATPDRSHPPAVAEPKILELQNASTFEINESTKVRVVHVPQARKVEITFRYTQGVVDLFGHTDLKAELLDLFTQGSKHHKPAELASKMDRNDWEWGLDIGSIYTTLDFSAPVETYKEAFSVLNEVISEPKLRGKDLKRERDDWLHVLINTGPNSQAAVASRAMSYSIYPKTHKLGKRTHLGVFDATNTKELTEAFSKLFDGSLEVIVAGDVKADDIKALFEASAVTDVSGEHAHEPIEPATIHNKILAVDMPGQQQAAIRVVWNAPKLGHDDAQAVQIARWVLGGHFLSRLNSNLREDKGFTYGTRAIYKSYPTDGKLVVRVDVKAQNTGEAISEIEVELNRLVSEPITDTEWLMARRTFIANFNDTLQDAVSASSTYNDLADQGETAEEGRASLQQLVSLKTADGAKPWFEKPRTWVIVGDRKLIEEQLKDRTVQWISAEKAFMGDFDLK